MIFTQNYISFRVIFVTWEDKYATEGRRVFFMNRVSRKKLSASPQESTRHNFSSQNHYLIPHSGVDSRNPIAVLFSSHLFSCFFKGILLVKYCRQVYFIFHFSLSPFHIPNFSVSNLNVATTLLQLVMISIQCQVIPLPFLILLYLKSEDTLNLLFAPLILYSYAV